MTFRIISRLDIKPPNLVKGVHLEGLRKLGDPSLFSKRYFDEGIDEIFYQDVVASLYNQNSLEQLIAQTAREVFVPFIVGGGVRSAKDAISLSRNGADKIAINTAAVNRPDLLKEVSEILGAQAIVLNLELKKRNSEWLVMTESGREHSGLNIQDFLTRIDQKYIGEIAITSIDCEGTLKGPDFELINFVRPFVHVPLLVNGGIATIEDVVHLHRQGANGVIIASAFHYQKIEISHLKNELIRNGIEVRI